jgi:hypothetical protein
VEKEEEEEEEEKVSLRKIKFTRGGNSKEQR